MTSSLPTWALWLVPWRVSPPNAFALDRVLAKYGLELLPGAQRGLEIIAAQGLSPEDAAALAEDLRGLGLHARVSQDDALVSSSRITNALVAQFLTFIATLPVSLTLLPALIGRGVDFWVIWGAIVAVGLAALVGGITVALRGGNRLEVAALPPRDTEGLGAVVATVRRVAAHLPGHVGGPLLERARQLAARAAAQPDGQAAAELRLLADELSAEQDGRDANDARALRRDLFEARRAMQELNRS